MIFGGQRHLSDNSVTSQKMKHLTGDSDAECETLIGEIGRHLGERAGNI